MGELYNHLGLADVGTLLMRLAAPPAVVGC